jgi:hypothetical protein
MRAIASCLGDCKKKKHEKMAKKEEAGAEEDVQCEQSRAAAGIIIGLVSIHNRFS